MATVTGKMEMQFGGGYVNITSDTMARTITVEYGIRGTGPGDLVASPGMLRFALQNKSSNSGGVVGYYSPGHASVRSGFDLGQKVKFTLTSGSAYVKFIGYISDIEPVPGSQRDRITWVTCHDWLGETAYVLPRTIPAQVGATADACLLLVSGSVEKSTFPFFDVGGVFPYAFDSSESERQSALSLIQQIAVSEYGRVFEIYPTSGVGDLYFKARASIFGLTSAVTLNDSMLEMVAPQSRDRIINRVKVTTHPRTIDAAATSILYQLQTVTMIPAGKSVTFTAPYTDPSQRAARVGGTDMVTPVASTDYKANAAADGLSGDLTSSVTPTVTFGANTADVTLANGAAVPAYIGGGLAGSFFQLRGRGIYTYQEAIATAEDATSITAYGQSEFGLDMPFQSDPNIGQAVADYILSQYKDPHSWDVSVTFFGNSSTTLMDAALAREVGDAVTIVETVTGVNHLFLIQAVTLRLEPGQNLYCSWLLKRADATDYFTLDSDVLDGTAVLAPL